jgi:PAS domain S-box-containing protein
MAKKGKDGYFDRLRKKAERYFDSDALPFRRMSKEEARRTTHELNVHSVDLEMQNLELQEAQVELERIRSKYTGLFDFAPIGYAVLDANGKIEEINLTAAAMLGVERDTLQNQSFADYIQDGRCLLHAAHHQVMQGCNCVRSEVRLRCKDREGVFADLLMDPERDIEPQVVRCRVAIIDITAHKQLEEEIKDIARFPAENPFPILRVAADGTVLYSNNPGRVILDYWGCELNEKVPCAWVDLIVHVLESDRYHVEEIRCGGKTFSIAIAPIPEDGYVNLYGRDVTVIRQNEAQLSTTLEHLTEGVVVADVNGNVFHWNPAAMAMYGFSKLSECRRKLPEFAALFELSDASGVVLPVEQWPLARVLQGESLKNEEITIRWLQTHHCAVFNFNGNLARDKDGNPLMAIISITDITARKQAEEELMKSYEELKQFNRMAVGRELRMIELKEEVNSLCREAGLSPRYEIDDMEGVPFVPGMGKSVRAGDGEEAE